MKKLLMIVAATFFLAIAGSTPAKAQVIDRIVANIPFVFTVNNTTLPAGEYTIRRIDSVEPAVMEINRSDSNEKLVFLVRTAEANKEARKTTLIFDRVGDQYFLSRIFEAGDYTGVELQQSRSERHLEKEGAIRQTDSVVIPAHTGMSARR